MSKSNKEYLFHIRDEIGFILKTTKDKDFQDFIEDTILKKAIERSFEIIGEAVKKLSDDYKKQYQGIEWRMIAGTRDRLIHNYMGVDYEILWDVIINKLPDLKEKINKLIYNAE